MTRIKTFNDWNEARDWAAANKKTGSAWRVWTLTPEERKKWWLFDTTRPFAIWTPYGLGFFMNEDGTEWVSYKERLVWIKSELRERLETRVTNCRLAHDASWVAATRERVNELIDNDKINSARIMLNHQGGQ